MVFDRVRAVLGLILFGTCSLVFAQSSLAPSEDEEGKSSIPRFDLLRMRYESDEARGFDRSNMELERMQFAVGGFLGRPINLGSDWKMISFLNYKYTELDFDRMTMGVPFEDQELHEASLNGVVFRQVAGSSWTYGAWGRVRFSSDAQDVNGDDFFYDLGLGAGYRVNDQFFAGLAFVGLEIGRDSLYVPGPVVMWTPSEDFRFGVMGPLLISSWEVSDSWTLALRGAPSGGTWNVDENGASHDYDLSSYVIRLHTEHRLRDQLWLSLGVGYIFGGDFEVRDSSGDRLFQDDLEGGLSFSIGLRLRAW